MKKKDETLVDLRLGKLGIEPNIFLFDLNVAPFRGIMIAETSKTWLTIRGMLHDIWGNVMTTITDIEKPTRLREELRKRGIYGVAICDIHDQFDLPLGRTIAKGRLWKHLKSEGAKKEAEKIVFKYEIEVVVITRGQRKENSKRVKEEKINDLEKIEEAIEAGMAKTEATKGVEQSDSYFMLERLLKCYAWKCWRRGVDTYNKKR